MFVSILAFSIMHLCVKFLPDIPVVQIIFTRSLFSLCVCLGGFVIHKKNPWGNHKILLVLRGVTGLLGLAFFFYSIQRMPLATAITISNLIPIFTLIMAFFFLKEKIKPFQWLFFLLSFLGVLMVKGFDPRVSTLDVSIAIAGAFFAGTAHFVVRKLKDTDDAMVIVFYFPLVSIPIILPFLFYQWVNPTSIEWVLLALVSFFTHIGQVYLTRAYQVEEVNKVANIYFLGIVLALFYGYFLFGETFNFLAFSGMGVIVAGIFLNVWYSRK